MPRLLSVFTLFVTTKFVISAVQNPAAQSRQPQVSTRRILGSSDQLKGHCDDRAIIMEMIFNAVKFDAKTDSYFVDCSGAEGGLTRARIGDADKRPRIGALLADQVNESKNKSLMPYDMVRFALYEVGPDLITGVGTLRKSFGEDRAATHYEEKCKELKENLVELKSEMEEKMNSSDVQGYATNSIEFQFNGQPFTNEVHRISVPYPRQ
ncbi:hypothetical protein Ddc_18137 [Ditylenchus destructor]|nr:hypothetical protein Ddc_18137 [Ditylenchus destructor]